MLTQLRQLCRDRPVIFAKQRSTLAVADDREVAAIVRKHSCRNLPGVGPRTVCAHRLSAKVDLCGIQQTAQQAQVDRSRAHDKIERQVFLFAEVLGQQLAQLAVELLSVLPQVV